nr:reverse transcriptase domain-containing protein [Sulfitobacter undariae]
MISHEGQHRPSRCLKDTLKLRDLTKALSRILPRSTVCRHLRGHGRQKGAVRQVQPALPEYRFVCRTNVKSFYASIDHDKLPTQVARHVTSRPMMNLLVQYMRRTVEYGGTFREVSCGITAGCCLSPLMGAFHLHDLDVAMTTRHSGCFYIRYMDDILIMAPSRWKLRRAIAAMNRELAALGLRQHPDKITIGPIARGFDFLGYHHAPTGLRLSAVTVKRHQEKLTRLYEPYHRQLRAYRNGWGGQSTIPGRHDAAWAYLNKRPVVTSHEDITQLLKVYQRRFYRWASGGLETCGKNYLPV